VPARVTMKVSGSAAREQARPTIICVSHAVPWPPRAGNEFRVYRMLQRLRAVGYRIVLVAAPLPGDPIDGSRFDALVTTFGNVIYCERDGTVRYRLDECQDVLSQLDQRLTGSYAVRLGETRPLSSRGLDLLTIDRTYCHETVIAVVSELQLYLKPSAILSEYVWMSRFLPLVDPDVLKIIDTHDVFSSKHEKVATYGIEYFDVPVEEEVRRLLRANVVVAIQQAEAHMLEEILPGREVLVAGVDFDVVSASTWPDSPVAFLVGSDNPMNIVGLRDLLRFAWPEIRRRVPEAVLEVAGRIGRAVHDCTDGVRVLGNVENLGPCYARSRVVVNPTAAGTGLKVKTVEALSHLRPIVTWPNGLDGVPGALADLVPTAEDWLTFADRAAAYLTASAPPFDEGSVTAIRRELSPQVVYGSLEARLARYFDAARDRKST
jgi:Glycosyl transferases group 1